jgi:hypothetical protein
MQNNRVTQMETIQKDALELFKKKNSDYGDAFATYGTIGVMVRITDKLNRFVNINNTSVSLVKNETIRDTLIDLHNYAAMAIMILDEKNETNANSKKNEQEFFIDPNMRIY